MNKKKIFDYYYIFETLNFLKKCHFKLPSNYISNGNDLIKSEYYKNLFYIKNVNISEEIKIKEFKKKEEYLKTIPFFSIIKISDDFEIKKHFKEEKDYHSYLNIYNDILKIYKSRYHNSYLMEFTSLYEDFYFAIIIYTSIIRFINYRLNKFYNGLYDHLEANNILISYGFDEFIDIKDINLKRKLINSFDYLVKTRGSDESLIKILEILNRDKKYIYNLRLDLVFKKNNKQNEHEIDISHNDFFDKQIDIIVSKQHKIDSYNTYSENFNTNFRFEDLKTKDEFVGGYGNSLESFEKEIKKIPYSKFIDNHLIYEKIENINNVIESITFTNYLFSYILNTNRTKRNELNKIDSSGLEKLEKDIFSNDKVYDNMNLAKSMIYLNCIKKLLIWNGELNNEDIYLEYMNMNRRNSFIFLKNKFKNNNSKIMAIEKIEKILTYKNNNESNLEYFNLELFLTDSEINELQQELSLNITEDNFINRINNFNMYENKRNYLNKYKKCLNIVLENFEYQKRFDFIEILFYLKYNKLLCDEDGVINDPIISLVDPFNYYLRSKHLSLYTRDSVGHIIFNKAFGVNITDNKIKNIINKFNGLSDTVNNVKSYITSMEEINTLRKNKVTISNTTKLNEKLEEFKDKFYELLGIGDSIIKKINSYLNDFFNVNNFTFDYNKKIEYYLYKISNFSVIKETASDDENNEIIKKLINKFSPLSEEFLLDYTIIKNNNNIYIDLFDTLDLGYDKNEKDTIIFQLDKDIIFEYNHKKIGIFNELNIDFTKQESVSINTYDNLDIDFVDNGIEDINNIELFKMSL